MKRFLSLLLVAILIVTSVSIMASAAVPGETVTIPVTVSGEFVNFLISIEADSGLSIESISGTSVISSSTTGKANWAGAANTNSYTVEVTVKIDENIKPGTYWVNGSAERASKVVGTENDTDGILDGLMATNVTVTGGYIVIEEPTCDHDYQLIDSKEPTCTEEGFKTYECSKCGHTYTEVIAKGAHVLADGWKYNGFKHWHVCSVCGTEFDHADHGDWQYIIVKEATKEEDGLQEVHCGVCDYYFNEVIDKDKDPVPPTGDITPVIALGVTSLITLAGTSLYVFKRKAAK